MGLVLSPVRDAPQNLISNLYDPSTMPDLNFLFSAPQPTLGFASSLPRMLEDSVYINKDLAMHLLHTHLRNSNPPISRTSSKNTTPTPTQPLLRKTHPTRRMIMGPGRIGNQ